MDCDDEEEDMRRRSDVLTVSHVSGGGEIFYCALWGRFLYISNSSHASRISLL